MKPYIELTGQNEYAFQALSHDMILAIDDAVALLHGKVGKHTMPGLKRDLFEVKHAITHSEVRFNPLKDPSLHLFKPRHHLTTKNRRPCRLQPFL